MAQRKSFRDPVTGVLKAHGFIEEAAPGDVARDEAEEFDLMPGLWRWDDEAWVRLEE